MDDNALKPSDPTGAYQRPAGNGAEVTTPPRTVTLFRGRLVLLATFALTAALFLCLALFSYDNLQATRQAGQSEKHTYLVIIELERLLSSLKDAESGQRGYVITGNKRYLEPYHDALLTVKDHLDTLRRLVKDNPEQMKRLAAIEPLIQAKLNILDEVIELRTSGGFPKASIRIMAGHGKDVMENLRREIGQAGQVEERLLRERSEREREYARRDISLLILGNLLGLAVLSTLYLLLWREFNRRMAYEGDLLASRDLLEAQNAELRRAGDERQEREALLGRYSDLYDYAPVGYFNLDPGGAIRAVNLTGARLLGAERASLVGRNLDLFLSPDTKGPFHDFLEGVFATGLRNSCEVVIVRQDTVPVFAQVEGMLSESREDCRAVIVDISDLKRSEDEKIRLEEQLHQAQKMESVGRLAGGVAHDFNNMLSVILGHSNLALMDQDPAQPLYTSLMEIRKAAERSAELTRQLLAFARRQPVAPKVLDLNQTLAGMLNMLKRIIGENVDLEWHPGEDLWPVRVDPSQMDQILANLCSNSRDAIPDTGKISIVTSNCSIDESYCAQNPGFVPGDFVRLAVSDNGCGMDRETLAHIFEPFFTTKDVGKGTGLGLATVFGAVKQNNGFINVYSEVGVGTTFTVYFPRQLEQPEQVAELEAPKPFDGGKAAILLVEDEPAVLDMAAKILTRQGYTVLAAGSPEQALRLAGEHPEIALLLTDVIMPGMSGRELARQLVLLHPDLKRLFMSGYTSDIIAHQGVLDEGVHFIQKPFTSAALVAKVRQVLES